MRGNIENKKDIDKTSHAGDKGSNNYIKFKKGRIFVRILNKEFVSEFIHSFEIGKKFNSFACLGGLDKKGYSPETCPACKVAKEHFWDKIKEMKDNPKFEKSERLQGEAEALKVKGKTLITKQVTKFIAIAGEAEKIKIKTKTGFKIEYSPEWEKEAKILQLSKVQFDKLTAGIFENYDFMKNSDDIINRNLMFVKEAAKGEETKQNTPIEIIPCKEKSEAPEYENELPDIERTFNYKTADEIKKIMKEFLNSGDAEFEEDEEAEDQDDDFEDDSDEDFDDEMAGDEFGDDEDEETEKELEDEEFEEEAEKETKKFQKKVANNRNKKESKKPVKKTAKKKSKKIEDDEF